MIRKYVVMTLNGLFLNDKGDLTVKKEEAKQFNSMKDATDFRDVSISLSEEDTENTVIIDND